MFNILYSDNMWLGSDAFIIVVKHLAVSLEIHLINFPLHISVGLGKVWRLMRTEEMLVINSGCDWLCLQLHALFYIKSLSWKFQYFPHCFWALLNYKMELIMHIWMQKHEVSECKTRQRKAFDCRWERRIS